MLAHYECAWKSSVISTLPDVASLFTDPFYTFAIQLTVLCLRCFESAALPPPPPPFPLSQLYLPLITPTPTLSRQQQQYHSQRGRHPDPTVPERPASSYYDHEADPRPGSGGGEHSSLPRHHERSRSGPATGAGEAGRGHGGVGGTC